MRVSAIPGKMDLRDYLAAKALPAVVSRYKPSIDIQSQPPYDTQHIANIAYLLADAMLKARALKQPEPNK